MSAPHLAAAANPYEDGWSAEDPGKPPSVVEEEVPDPAGSWAPMDLGPYLRGEVKRPVPAIGLRRRDGLQLIYPGKEHTVIGEMECGKSWLLVACAADELTNGHHVTYLHFEESDPSDTVERLLALGVAPDVIQERFHFSGPDDPVNAARIAAVLEHQPRLVILDGVNEALTLHSLKINENEGAAELRRLVIKPCIRAGAAVLTADHVAKSGDTRGRTAIGGVHKVNAISGTVILLENAEPFGREQRGRSHVYVTKDRPGHLRRHGRPDREITGKTYLGELVVDDTQQYSPDLVLRFYALNDKTASAEADDELDELLEQQTGPASSPIAQNVLAVLAAAEGCQFESVRKLLAALRAAKHEAQDDRVRNALADLEHAGLIEEFKNGIAKGYRLTASQDQNTSTASPTASPTASASASPKDGGTRDALAPGSGETASHRVRRTGTHSDAVEFDPTHRRTEETP